MPKSTLNHDTKPGLACAFDFAYYNADHSMQWQSTYFYMGCGCLPVRLFAAMLRVFRMSGEELASIDSETLSEILALQGDSVEALKRYLGFSEDGQLRRHHLVHNNRLLEDHEPIAGLGLPLDLHLASLPPFHTRDTLRLKTAVECGNREAVRSLLEGRQHPDPPSGDPLLLQASAAGQVEAAHYLLHAAADCNRVGQAYSQTALHVSSAAGQLELVSKLLQFRACIDQADCLGRSALFVAAGAGNTGIVECLTDGNADCNLANWRGQTPLWAACQRGQEAAARCLLAARADHEKADKQQQSPLWAACDSGHAAVVELLIGVRAECEQPSCDGWTPLYAACCKTHEAVVAVLLAARVHCEPADTQRTPLLAACESRNLALVQLLVKSHADVNETDADGQTPLLTACRNGSEAIARFVIEARANVGKNDDPGLSRLFLASKRKHQGILALLMDARASIAQPSLEQKEPEVPKHHLQAAQLTWQWRRSEAPLS